MFQYGEKPFKRLEEETGNEVEKNTSAQTPAEANETEEEQKRPQTWQEAKEAAVASGELQSQTQTPMTWAEAKQNRYSRSEEIYSASGIELLQKDIYSALTQSGNYITGNYGLVLTDEGKGYLTQIGTLRKAVEQEKQFFQKNAWYFTQEELDAYNSALDEWGAALEMYESAMYSGRDVAQGIADGRAAMAPASGRDAALLGLNLSGVNTGIEQIYSYANTLSTGGSLDISVDELEETVNASRSTLDYAKKYFEVNAEHFSQEEQTSIREYFTQAEQVLDYTVYTAKTRRFEAMTDEELGELYWGGVGASTPQLIDNCWDTLASIETQLRSGTYEEGIQGLRQLISQVPDETQRNLLYLGLREVELLAGRTEENAEEVDAEIKQIEEQMNAVMQSSSYYLSDTYLLRAEWARRENAAALDDLKGGNLPEFGSSAWSIAVRAIMQEDDFEKYSTVEGVGTTPEEQIKKYEGMSQPERERYFSDLNIGKYEDKNLTQSEKRWRFVNGDINYSASRYAPAGYGLLQDSEKAVYNYLYQNPDYGAEIADAFLDEVLGEYGEYELQRNRAASERREAEDLADYVDYPVLREFAQFAVGVTSAVTGVVNWFDPDFDFWGATTAAKNTSAVLYERNPEWYAKYPMMASQSFGEMLPSLAASGLLGPTAGTIMTLITAGGQAVQEGVQEYGMTPWQARVYGLFVGASEAALQNLIGGIDALKGGESFIDKGANYIASRVSSIGGKVAIKMGGNVLGELTEENLQNYLEPAFRMLVGATDDYDAPTWQDFVDTTISTILLTVAMEGSHWNANYDLERFTQEEVVPWAEELQKASKEGSQMEKEADLLQERIARGETITPQDVMEIIERLDAAATQEASAEADASEEASHTKEEDTEQTEEASTGTAEETPGQNTQVAELIESAEGTSHGVQSESFTPENAQQDTEAVYQAFEQMSRGEYDSGSEMYDAAQIAKMAQAEMQQLEAAWQQGSISQVQYENYRQTMQSVYDQCAQIVAQSLNGSETVGAAETEGATVPVQSSPEIAQRQTTAAVNEIESGGNENAEVSYDGGQRDAGMGTGRSVGIVAESTDRSVEGSENSAQTTGVRNLKENARDQSAREIGVSNGSENKTLHVLSESQIESSKQLKQIRQDASEQGAKVVFFRGDLEIVEPQTGKAVKAEGLLQTNEDGSVTYYIREDKINRPAEKIYRHEEFHQLAQNKTGLMAELVRLLESKYGTQELAALVNRYVEAYDGIYGRFDESMTADEQEKLVMLYMEEVFADAYAGIKRGSRSIRSAEDVLQSRTSELETAQENLRGMQSQNAPPGQRYLYAGQTARTADMDSLRWAQEMQQQGEKMETIRKETGWHQGRDGKWRFEIDDSMAEYRRDGDARLLEEEGFQRLESLTDKWAKSFDGGTELTEAEKAEMERLEDEYSDRYWEEKYMLRDFLKHDALFDAYPRLKGVGLVFDSLEAGHNGYLDQRSNTIVLSNQLLGETKRTLLHEIQHILQRYEGFAYGSSPFYWATQDYNSGEKLLQKLKARRSEILEGLNLIDETRYTRYMELNEEMDRVQYNSSNEASRTYDTLELEQDALYEELYECDWFKELLDIDRQIQNRSELYNKLYRNTAGEIEARDTAARRNLTAQERREYPVDYGDENTVFAEDGADAFSIERTKEMSWEKQIEGYFRGDGTIRRSDYLYIGECEVGGRNSVPLVVPTSVITKAIRTEKGSRSGHGMTKADIIKLKNGIENAVAVVDNPSRNALVFITSHQDAAGNYIIAAFDKNNSVGNNNAHRATTIHGRENIATLLQNLGSDATIFLKNENRLNRILPRSQILKSLTLTAKVEPINGIISSDLGNVKQKFSVEEETAEMDEAASRIAQQDPILEETRTEVDPAAAEKKRQKAEAKSISQLKNGIKSAQQAIATQTAAKVALRNAGQLTAEVKTMIDNKIEDIRQTLRIEQAALKQKQAAQEKEEKKKKQAEIEMQTAEQKARTAQKELRQDLLNLFSVKAGRRSETAQAIDAISDELLRSGKITHESRKALLEVLYKNGEGLVEPEEYYSEIRAHLNKARIYVSDTVRAEFGDDWNAVRARAFGNRVYLTNNRNDMGIDSWTHEFVEAYGGRFDETADLKTQLETILELAEEGRTEHLTIPEMMRRNAEDTGFTVAEQVEKLNQKVDTMLDTFAQKADLEIRLRQQSVKTILVEHEYFRNVLQRQREARAEREEREKVMSDIHRLTKMRKKTSPEYKRQIDETLKGIDTVARRISDRGIEDLQELQRLYYEAREAEGENFLKNDYVEKRIDRLNEMQLDDLNISKIRELGNVVSSLVNSILNSKKLLADQHNRMIDEVSLVVNREIAESDGSKDGTWHQYFLNHLDGKRIFGKLSGWVDGDFEQLGKNLSAGQEREMHFQLNASRVFEEFLAKEANREWLEKAHGKNAEWIKLEVPDAVKIRRGHFDAKPKTIEITPMMRVAILMHSKNEDNLFHIKTGGFKIPNKALYAKGKIRQAYDKGEIVKMEPLTVKAIARQCSPQEAAFATLLEKYFGGVSKNAINEVSMQLEGFERAGVRYYYPIESVKDFLENIDGAQSRDMSVQAIGSIANERVHGGTPIVLEDATSTLMRQIGNTAKYYGYAIPIRDLNAVLSVNFHETDNAYSGSVKDTLSKKWGSSAIDYLNKLMADLQMPKQSTDIASRFAEKLRGKYARAVIAFNLSSLLKQMTSYPVALPYLKADALAHGFRKVQKSELAALEKYSAVYWYRNLGNSTTELGDVTSTQGIEDKLPFLFKWTQAMDSFTTRRLLAASEYRVQKDLKIRPGTQEEIDAGTDRYWTEVAKLFNDVTLKTQSNSSQMERPQITRANNSNISRWFTMFKTDAFQQYGMLVEASGRMKAAKKAYDKDASAENKAKLKEAKKFMARTVVGTLTGQLSCGQITSLLKIVRFDDDEFRDEDGEFDVGKLAEYLAWSTVEGYCGFFVGGEILYSVLDASIDELTGEGGRWWDIEATGLSTINDIAEGIIDFAGGLKDGNLWEVRGWFRDLVIGVSKGFGLPTENVEKYLLMFVRWASPEWAEEHENFWNEITKSNLSKESFQTIDAAISVMMDNRTTGMSDKNKEEIARLYVAGGTGAVPTGIPTSVTYTKEDGEEVSVDLSASEQRKYRKVWNKTVSGAIDDLMDSEDFRNADDEGKTELLNKLYQYGNQVAKNAVVPDKEVDKWVAQGQAAVDDGIPLDEYICFRVGLSDIDGKDDSGKTIDGLRGQRCMEYLESMGWTDEQEQNIYLNILASESKSETTEQLLQAGLSWEQVNDIVGMASGKKWDHMDAIIRTNAGDGVKVKALAAYASEKELPLIQTGYRFGVKLSWYAEVRNNADADGSGSISQDEAAAYIDTMGLDLQDAAYLWQMVTDGKNGKNNPFSSTLGAEFYDAVHDDDEVQEKDAEKEEDSGGIFGGSGSMFDSSEDEDDGGGVFGGGKSMFD